jgi:ribonuclease D|tara:strand:+ start:39739 stop:40575 length:837 start_codon:yes stop_codon:yes gene_type:complete
MSFTFIERLEDLSYLNKELLDKPFVGVDTEFRRTTKDNMRLALLQINDSEEIYLIDTVLIEDPLDHVSFLFSESVTKIFHSCKEDIEAIYSWTGQEMVNVFDTQLADAFLDGHYSIGYQGLVEEKLDIRVDKGETRSNWIRRPLTDSQLNYAASDVEFLIELFIDQRKSLIDGEKLKWLEEEVKFLSKRIFNPLESIEEIPNDLTKAEEKALLNKFNDIVLYTAQAQNINPTLFFSKKSQKEFLRFALDSGLESALKNTTNWRSELIQEPLGNLLKGY